MAKLILWNLVSLDGCFDKATQWSEPWQLDFFPNIFCDELMRFILGQLESTEAILFGRITYEGMAAYWKKAEGDVAKYMNSLPKYVVSSRLKQVDWNNSRLLGEKWIEEVQALKLKPGKDLYVFGSGQLCWELMEKNLFDEIRLLVVPVILGNGKRLFEDGLPRREFKLLESLALPTGAVILRYAPTTP
jgi:dihydrofolate reductase